MDILNLKAHLQWAPLTKANSQFFLNSFTYLEPTIQIYEPMEAPLNNHTTNYISEAETSGQHQKFLITLEPEHYRMEYFKY